jgi:hypothetical protein
LKLYYAPKPEASEATVKAGEKVRDDGYQFTVTSVTCGARRVGREQSGAP